MIKAILFDMDGVLIDAKDWHYESLNSALALFGMEITRSDHLSTFDGLPTKKKLEILSRTKGLPVGLHDLINKYKQKKTFEITIERCRPVYHHQYALSRLKREGKLLAVCSNSIRKTVETMMDQAELTQYLEFFISNQEVSAPKPDPEIYNMTIQRLNLSPKECLIVEDNEHGLQAARASGAYVLQVSGVGDVTYDRLSQVIFEIEGAEN